MRTRKITPHDSDRRNCAQFLPMNERLGQKLRGEQLRGLMALMVLVVLMANHIAGMIMTMVVAQASVVAHIGICGCSAHIFAQAVCAHTCLPMSE